MRKLSLRSPASCSGAIGCPSTIGISSTGRRADAAIDVVGHGAPVSSGARCGKSRAGVSSRRPRRLQLANDVVLPFAFSYFECTHKMQNAVRLFAIKNSGHDADSQCVSWSSRGRPLAGVVRGASRTSHRRRARASRSRRSARRPERRHSAAPANVTAGRGTSITPKRSPGDLEESAMDGNFLERAARSVNGSADETTDSSQRVDMATFERWLR